LVHSQAGAFGWPVADARPGLVKAILAIEPNGPPFYGVDFVGAPDYFREGSLALSYGVTAVPLTYAPPVADASELAMVREGQGGRPGSGQMLDAEGTGAATSEPAGHSRSWSSRRRSSYTRPTITAR